MGALRSTTCAKQREVHSELVRGNGPDEVILELDAWVLKDRLPVRNKGKNSFISMLACKPSA